MNRIVTTVLAFGLTCSASASLSSNQEQRTYTFGVVPQQSASRLAKMWAPFLSELSARTGATFEMRTTKDIPTFEACLASGSYDFAYMNPMHYAVFAGDEGYRAVAHQSDKRLRGLIVTRTDAEFDDLTRLQNADIAFPSPGAFGASILTRSALTDRGVEFEPNYVRSHDSVYRAVAAGLMAAGGGVTRTFNSVDPSIRAQLKVIYQTEGFTPHAIAAHSTVEAELSEDLQTHLLDIASARPELVKGLGMNGFQIASDADWDDVRGLNMSLEETGIAGEGGIICPSD